MVFVCSVFITLRWAFHIMKIFIMLFYKLVIHMIVDKIWTPLDFLCPHAKHRKIDTPNPESCFAH